jgi:hypothetical protein
MWASFTYVMHARTRPPFEGSLLASDFAAPVRLDCVSLARLGCVAVHPYAETNPQRRAGLRRCAPLCGPGVVMGAAGFEPATSRV